jgi:hypothetical protein
MKKTYLFIAALTCLSFGAFAQDPVVLQGVMDFTTPSFGVTGKAIHVHLDSNVADMSIYGIGVANNGGGTDSVEYTFPAISGTAGDDILVVRDSAVLAAYFAGCWPEFETVITDMDGVISQNGDDAIELFKSGIVIETYGDIDKDGTGEPWEYLDAWAYKVDGAWTTGAVNCTDNTTTIYDASCLYPICPAILIDTVRVQGEGGATTITVANGTLQMEVTTTPSNAGDSTVTWSVNDTTLATIDASGLLTAKLDGVVTVKATANDGGGAADSVDITLSNQSVSVGFVGLQQIKLYPNPAKTELFIDTDKTVSVIQVYSLSGVLVKEEMNAMKTSVHELQNGVYFIKVKVGDHWAQNRFIKQ